MSRFIRFVFLALAFCGLLGFVRPADAASRIKDICDFEGIRDNMLVGYGLVVGLNGTGDSLNQAIFTRESLIGMLQRLGVNAQSSSLSTSNVAAVMVTATLPPFARQGERIDVQVSALGDAKSLNGGTLLVTPLLGADGEVYAVAQGPVATGGFSAAGQAASITKGVPTSGRIANGAIVEREVGFQLSKMKKVNIILRNPDLTTARRIADVINAHMKMQIAKPTDPSTVVLTVPPSMKGDAVGLLTDIENLMVEPSEPARVVIDEQNGIIVMGQNVRISTVAVAQGNLTVRINETPQVSQPSAFAPAGQPANGAGPTGTGNVQFAPGGGGATVVVPRTTVQVNEHNKNRMTIIPEGVSLRQLVNNLNALGVGPRDMISILQAIKSAGALQADLEVM